MKPRFQWRQYPTTCIKCLECVDTCKALTISNLQRIVRDPNKCTMCETCSTICDNITTEYTYEKTEEV